MAEKAGGKLYASYSIMNGRGEDSESVAQVRWVVLDMDVKDEEVASDDQFQLIADAFPASPLIRANGMQVFFRYSGALNGHDQTWADTMGALAALGEYVESLTGLHYDAHHTTLSGYAALQQNHCYRLPWGSSRRGPVEAFLPAVGADGAETVAEALGEAGAGGQDLQDARQEEGPERWQVWNSKKQQVNSHENQEVGRWI